MVKEEKDTKNNMFSYLACLTFIVFFSKISDISEILASIHINLLSFATTFAFFFITGAYRTIEWRQNGSVKLLTFFLVIGAGTIPFAVWPTNAFELWREFALINILISYFCLASIQNEKQLVRIIYAFLIATFILVSALLRHPIIINGRAFVAYSYDPNDLALIFAVTFPLVVGQFLVADIKKKVLLGGYLVMLVIGILKTGSRGGLLAMSVATIMILLSSVVKVKLRHKILIVLLVGGFLFSSAANNVLQRWDDVISGQDYNVADTDEEGAGGRIAIWKAGLQLFGENLFLGVGVGNSSTAMGERFGQYGWMTMHNSYLQAALELGIGGLVIFLLMLRSVWNNCSQVIKLQEKSSMNRHIFMVAYSLRISLVTFMVAAFFLSQAYSLIVPVYVIVANRVKFLAEKVA